MVIKTRAENYTFDELKNIKPINYALLSRISAYINSDEQHPVSITGIKGYGKTLNVRKALAKTIKSNSEIIPVMFIYKQDEQLRALEPTKIASKNSWGQRLDIIKDLSDEELLETANIIVLDDAHYMCEDIIDEKLELRIFTDFLSKMASEIDKGKKGILVSEDQLALYAGAINDPKLDSLLPKFGQIKEDIHQMNDLVEINKIYASVDMRARLEVPIITRESFDRLFETSGIDADYVIKSFLYDNSGGNPRTFADFAAHFPRKEKITINDMIILTKEKLKKRSLAVSKDRYENFCFMMDFPYFELVSINPKSIAGIKNKFKTYDELETYVKKLEEHARPIIRNIQENIENIDKSSPDYKKAYRNTANTTHDASTRVFQCNDFNKIDYWKTLTEWKKLEKHLKKHQTPYNSIPELNNFKGNCRYVYTELKHMKNIVEESSKPLNDEDFDKLWRMVPENYVSRRLSEDAPGYIVLDKPFRIAFTESIAAAGYLDEMKEVFYQ